MMMRASNGGEVPMSCLLQRHGRPCYLPLLSSPSQTTSISLHQADILAPVKLTWPGGGKKSLSLLSD